MRLRMRLMHLCVPSCAGKCLCFLTSPVMLGAPRNHKNVETNARCLSDKGRIPGRISGPCVYPCHEQGALLGFLASCFHAFGAGKQKSLSVEVPPSTFRCSKVVVLPCPQSKLDFTGHSPQETHTASLLTTIQPDVGEDRAPK